MSSAAILTAMDKCRLLQRLGVLGTNADAANLYAFLEGVRPQQGWFNAHVDRATPRGVPRNEQLHIDMCPAHKDPEDAPHPVWLYETDQGADENAHAFSKRTRCT